MKIIVNGAMAEVDATVVSYELVRRIAFNGKNDQTPSITYKHAAPPRTEGVLGPGNFVEIAEGTVFSVYVTGGA